MSIHLILIALGLVGFIALFILIIAIMDDRENFPWRKK